MNYKVDESLIIRTPLLPIKLSFNEADLKKKFSNKVSLEALFLASPVVYEECCKWLNGELFNEKDKIQLKNTLLKYALRMHTRSTPFGLFAGCGIARFGEKSNIFINDKKWNRNTRFDMNFTCALSQKLAHLPFVKPHLKHFPNSSIYYVKNKIRYVEYNYVRDKRIHQISAIESSIYIEKVIKLAEKGATTDELATCLVEKDVSKEDAILFIDQLIDAQLLVNELEPNLTGQELLPQIVDKLLTIQNKQQHPVLTSIICVLQNALSELNEIDKGLGNEALIYKRISNSLKELNVPFNIGKLFQTDLFPIAQDKNVPLYLDSSIKKQIYHVFRVLNKLTPVRGKSTLNEFQNSFYERYEEKEVPLVEVLDAEIGIGYGKNSSEDLTPLVNDLVLPSKYSKARELIWNNLESFLLKKLLKSQKENKQIVTIDISELDDFEGDWEDLPDSMSVLFQHLGESDDHNRIYIKGISGPSAINLLGRFGTSNQEIENIINEISAKEKAIKSDKILAEIVHLPESRTGNILMRPAFRDYEIPYLAKSILSKSNQIELEDLYLSIKKNRLFLRSKRLNKEVIPRLGNAHNYVNNSLPSYHFLCDLQKQGIRNGIYFDWGQLKNEFSFLPRVEIENVIVSLATWQLKKDGFKLILDSNLTHVKQWQKKWNLPRFVVLADGDNKLIIDLENELSISMFVNLIKNRPAIILEEYLFNEETAIVKNKSNQVYSNEFIAVLIKEDSNSKRRPTSNALKEHSAQKTNNNELKRSFSLGSEWLYYKLYSGVKTADELLTIVLKPFCEKLIEENLIDHWFFIRYRDPDYHLRIRFHITELNNIGIVIRKFQECIAEYENTGLIWKVQAETYKREIERYGLTTMELAEQLFYYDSVCTVNILSYLNGDEGEHTRWKIGLRIVDEFLTTFGLDLEQKKSLLEPLKLAFAEEFNSNKYLNKQIDRKYRENRTNLEYLFDRENDSSNEVRVLLEVIKKYSQGISPIAKQILNLYNDGQVNKRLDSLLHSYIHMTLNRLFKSEQRTHELVIYDFLWRYYRSQLARQKNAKKKVNSVVV